MEQREQVPAPPLAIDLEAEIAGLHREPAWQTGISRKSLVRYPDLRINLIAIRAGMRIEEHQNPGRISVQPIVGHIRMHALGRAFDLPRGKVLVLDRAVRHDVEAVEDSAFVLTVAYPDTAQAAPTP